MLRGVNQEPAVLKGRWCRSSGVISPGPAEEAPGEESWQQVITGGKGQMPGQNRGVRQRNPTVVNVQGQPAGSRLLVAQYVAGRCVKQRTAVAKPVKPSHPTEPWGPILAAKAMRLNRWHESGVVAPQGQNWNAESGWWLQPLRMR